MSLFFAVNMRLVYMWAKEIVDIGIYTWYKLIKEWYQIYTNVIKEERNMTFIQALLIGLIAGLTVLDGNWLGEAKFR